VRRVVSGQWQCHQPALERADVPLRQGCSASARRRWRNSDSASHRGAVAGCSTLWLLRVVDPAIIGLLDSRRIDLGLYDSLLRGALLDRDPDGWETNSWANRKVLDSAAAWFRMNESDALDLTFLIYQKRSGYPSVIDGQDSRQPNEHQRNRAREEAQKIIDKRGQCPRMTPPVSPEKTGFRPFRLAMAPP
jgi:hypothetical protein